MPLSFGAPPTRRKPTSGPGANGAGLCGTRRPTSRIRSDWTSSFTARAVSMPALLGSLGGWGQCSARGRRCSRRPSRRSHAFRFRPCEQREDVDTAIERMAKVLAGPISCERVSSIRQPHAAINLKYKSFLREVPERDQQRACHRHDHRERTDGPPGTPSIPTERVSDWRLASATTATSTKAR